MFALVGVYLLATAFSASDEDLVRGRTVTISQIGATLPISDPAASGIASHSAFEIWVTKDDWRHSLYVAIACRLLANGEAEKVKIEQRSIDELSRALRGRIECKPAKPAAPH